MAIEAGSYRGFEVAALSADSWHEHREITHRRTDRCELSGIGGTDH
jgi:hypothetical protein